MKTVLAGTDLDVGLKPFCILDVRVRHASSSKSRRVEFTHYVTAWASATDELRVSVGVLHTGGNASLFTDVLAAKPRDLPRYRSAKGKA